MTPLLTKTQLAILDALRQEPMTLADLSAHCRRTREAVRVSLPLLVSHRLVTRLSEPVQIGQGRPQRVYRRLTTWERAA